MLWYRTHHTSRMNKESRRKQRCASRSSGQRLRPSHLLNLQPTLSECSAEQFGAVCFDWVTHGHWQIQSFSKLINLQLLAVCCPLMHILCCCRAMDRKMLALEATRDLTKVWAHVDMDAFYAAAEELANPSLVGHRHLILIRHSQEHD